MKKVRTFVITTFCTLFVLGCGKKTELRELTPQEMELVQVSNRFGFRLLKAVEQNVTPVDNIILSPLSVSMALGMTLNGARTTTFDALRTTLDFGSLSQADINASYHSLIELLTTMDDNVQLEIANSIWYRTGFSVLPDFTSTVQTSFDAEIAALDFSATSSVDTINGWVSDSTHGKIDSIIDGPIPDDLVMFLVNVLYFKGAWTYKFDTDNTQDATFTADDGSVHTVRMMNQTAEFDNYSGPSYRAVRLPYGDGNFALTLILPKAGKTLTAVVDALTDDGFTLLSTQAQKSELSIGVPRFTLEYETRLDAALQTLGMGIAFSGEADFTGISSDGGLSISEVKHKTFIALDEKGTEAAAATEVGITKLAMPERLEFNRPFLFVLHDLHSQTQLFMGMVNKIAE